MERSGLEDPEARRDRHGVAQFHPEFKSKPLACHPIFKGFIKAALAYHSERSETPTLAGLHVVSGSKEIKS